MEIWQSILLALIQGFTEFLPISSSAHLVLIPQLTGWQDQGLAFDVTVHLGSLVAVCYYLRKTLLELIQGGIKSIIRQPNEHSPLAWLVILSTLPAIIFGLLFDDIIENQLRTIFVIALTTIIFGLLLAYSEKFKGQKNIQSLNWQTALFIGLMQSIALIPGTSRSGITITAALLIGLNFKSAAQYSFILAVPLILAASLFKALQLITSNETIDWLIFLTGFSVSAIFAWISIHFLLKLVAKIGLIPFVIYRLILGSSLLLFI